MLLFDKFYTTVLGTALFGIRGQHMLKGGTVDPFGDHRIAMAAAVAACRCEQAVTVDQPDCVSKSYPAFWEDLGSLQRV